MSSSLCDPLVFQPIFRRYLWGGRRLATMLGKSLGTGDDYAESWEVVDHHQDQSVVLEGPLTGHALHIEQGLATIDFTRGPVEPQRLRSTDQAGRQRLVECDYFVLDRCLFQQPFMVGGDDRFHLLAVLEGTFELAGIDKPLNPGRTLLLPAAAGVRKLVPLADRAQGTGEGRGGSKQAVVLDIYLP